MVSGPVDLELALFGRVGRADAPHETPAEVMRLGERASARRARAVEREVYGPAEREAARRERETLRALEREAAKPHRD